MGLGATNKRKGSNAERYYAKYFRELGHTHCQTARLASKLHDNAKIDLVFIPFNIQIKAGTQKNMNAGKELFFMKSAISAMFPKDDTVHSKPCLLFHYLQGTMGVKRTPEMEMVYMSLVQFNMFRSQAKDLEYLSMKEYKFDLNSEFKTVVSMTFEHFEEKILLKHYKVCQ
jgi:hypothetical protein